MRTLAAPDFEALRGLLAEEVSRLRASDALRPILVVTPGDLAREATRRDLARRLGGVLGVEVAAFAEWVRDAATPEIARRGARPLSEPGVERLVSCVLEDRAHRTRTPGPLLRAAETPGLARAVTRSLQDLRRGRFTPDDLTRAWRPAPDALRAELLLLYRDFVGALEAERLIDRVGEEELVTELLARETARDVPPLLLSGFHELTARQRSVVRTASSIRPVSLLIVGPGGPGHAAVSPLVDWARATGGDFVTTGARSDLPLTLEDGLFEKPRLTDPGGSALELHTYSTDAAEVRGIARRILEEVEENDRAFDEIAVTVTADGPSPLLFRRVFARAGIPLADRAGVPAPRTEGARRATAMARALAARRDVRDREAFDFLASAAQIPEDTVLRFRRARDTETAADSFRELHELRFGTPPSREVESSLAALATVYGKRPHRPHEFSRALAAALATITSREHTAERPDDACVLLVRPEGARSIVRPVVWHAGLGEGSVRRLPREDPLLPDPIREKLNEAGEHEGRTLPVRTAAREEKLLLARFAFEAGRERSVLSWSERSRTGAEPRNPSGLLLDVAAARAGGPLEPRDRAFREVVPAPPAAPARARPVDRTDLEIATLFRDETAGPDDLASLLADERARHLTGALRAAEHRWRPGRLTGWDGVLRDRRAIEGAWRRVDPARRALSPTALESLANCPFAFLVERVLRLGRDPEPEDDYDPRERGLVFHEILETVYLQLSEEKRLPLTPESLGTALRTLDRQVDIRRRSLAGESPARRALRGATLSALRNDLAIVLAREAHRPGGSRAVPTWFELSFGMRGERLTFALGDGTELPVRGKADRVDLRADGAIEVVDLKTGKPRVRSGRITSTDREKTSVHLQLPLYLDVVSRMLRRRPGRAVFYHATADSGFEEIDFDADDLEEHRRRIGRLLTGVLDHARRGWFPCTPGESCCWRRLAPACGPGVVARFRRKKSDPDVIRHLSLLAAADPPEDAP